MKILKKISSVLCVIVFTLVLLVLLGLVVSRFAGMQPLTVLTGSMEPEIPAGSLILVKSIDPHQLQPQDVLTYVAGPDTVVTHRVMSIVPDQEDPSVLRFRTRGDANTADDMYLVHENNVVGTPVLCIPVLGEIVNFVSQPPGIYLALGAIALMLILLYLPDAMKKDEAQAQEAAEGEGEAEIAVDGEAEIAADGEAEIAADGEEGAAGSQEETAEVK